MLRSEPRFWDLLTAPLMRDLPDAPVDTAPLADAVGERVLLSILWSAQTPEVASSTLRAEAAGACGSGGHGAAVARHCALLQVHAALLQLVAAERHGYLFALDVTAAKQADKKMRAFFVKATEANRFVSWVHHLP